ncbi:purine-binding chemotaxis protein CheW [Sphingomonas vulcanisoli]|uniref:Purine-binding chemotaxis protein CheW n=1 Tax=Sphingomonas vulcanisoli TaxID=1658060 RepID=A0ABX0TTP2_9SPHN|nr:chemotaxis protein CheW [Sphingomonas vulcanisoli]NIJ08888.1 purine-binding chemotaxis protein CheW [Sphingomonas vulcanisoli]
MESLYLIVRVAGDTVALRADGISSVVEIDAISAVPRVAPHIRGLFALRSRILTVIDSTAALGLGRCNRQAAHTAVVISSDGHGYALLVEEVVDVIEGGAPSPCVAVIGAGWSRVTVGQIETPIGDILLLDPTLLIQGPELLAA